MFYLLLSIFFLFSYYFFEISLSVLSLVLPYLLSYFYVLIKFKNSFFFSFSPTLIILYSFYGFYAPISELIIYGRVDELTYLSYIYYFISYIMLLLFLPKYDSAFNFNFKISNFKVFFVNFIIIVFIFYKLLFISSIFSLSDLFLFKITKRFTDFDQTWIIISYILVPLFVISLGNKSKLALFLFIFYVYFSFSLGNRREFFPVFFFIFSYYCFIKKIPFNIFTLLILLLFINAAAFLHYFRTSSNGLLDLIISNEFIYPFYTLNWALKNFNQDWINLFSEITVYIPRSIWESKPHSLAVQFVDFNSLKQGYAFMPISDLIFKFSFLFFIPLTFYLYLLRLFLSNSIFSISMLLMITDISRGEFQSIFFQLLIYLICFVSIYFNVNRIYCYNTKSI